ncbi:unnamed protein product [Triticum turgidum subsp. durum]|uniref:DUF4220 domain-containing protein n=1 Tax=Triticum turgidum subsp. durum TaxID=4567 RepID=A0A9R1BFY3_TRITD|nr:unnamed protein product [Triticum turgidum subsp. durum]
MAGFFMGEESQERLSLRVTRVLVIVSHLAHLTLAQLSGIRRRRDSGVRMSLVWVAYHVTEIITPIALGKVFLDTATAVSEELMFAFWAPFLLLHLGRPDNITSYALEHNELSPTQKAVLVLEIGGAIYGSYKQRFMRGDAALRAAFFIMLFLGSYKYVERAVALRRASFDSIRRSAGRKKLRRFTFEDEGRKWDNDDALLDAHGLVGVTMGAFADYQLNRRRYVPSYSGWKDVSEVVEMEASLMYDMLYTKASVIRTWAGYIIRVLSPPATATALYLFHSKEGQAMESADRTVTYTLLVGTLVLDVRWLLRALGSTWTYAFLVEQGEGKEWLLPVRRTFPDNLPRQAAMQSWYCVRRLLVSLDTSRLSLRSGPSGHRLLSGVGQHNLLQECCTCTPRPRGQLEKLISSFFTGLGKKKTDVKDELLEAVCTQVLLESRTLVGMRPISELDDYMRSNASNYSFESNLIALHVATDIFLLCKPTSIKSEASAKYEKQIRAISDYMMFLLAERQHMVLKQGDEGVHYKKARLDLEEIWSERGTSSSPTIRETKQLANILLEMDATEGSYMLGRPSHLYDRNDTLGIGAYWAFNLLDELEPGNYGRHPMQGQYIHKLEDFIPAFTDEQGFPCQAAQLRRRALNHCLADEQTQVLLLQSNKLTSIASSLLCSAFYEIFQ